MTCNLDHLILCRKPKVKTWGLLFFVALTFTFDFGEINIVVYCYIVHKNFGWLISVHIR